MWFYCGGRCFHTEGGFNNEVQHINAKVDSNLLPPMGGGRGYPSFAAGEETSHVQVS